MRTRDAPGKEASGPRGHASAYSCVGSSVETVGRAHARTPVWGSHRPEWLSRLPGKQQHVREAGPVAERVVAKSPRTGRTCRKSQAPPASGTVVRGACAGKVGCVGEGQRQSSHSLATKGPSGRGLVVGGRLGLSPSVCGLSLESRLSQPAWNPHRSACAENGLASLQPGEFGPGGLTACSAPETCVSPSAALAARVAEPWGTGFRLGAFVEPMLGSLAK